MRLLTDKSSFDLSILCSVAPLLLACSFIPVSAPLSAQTQADESLDSITVIAEPEPQTGDVQHAEHAGTHRHIERQELERQDVMLGDILAHETGVQFRQVGGLGTLTTVTLRGASSAATGIYLDGILLNSAANSTVDLSLLELLNLSAVDIYQGAAPAPLAGSNLGGAINLRSISALNKKTSTSASVTGGSFNTNRFQFSHRSTHNRWDVVAAASRENSDNDFSFLNNNATPLNPDDDTVEKRNNAQTKKLSGLGRIGFQWNKNRRSDLLIQASTRKLGVPEWLNDEDNEASYDNDTLEMQLVTRFDAIGNWNTSLSLFQHNQSSHYLDQFGQVGLDLQNTQSQARTSGIKSYWEHIGDKGTFSFNVSFRNESLDSTDSLTSNQNYEVDRRSVAAGMQYAYFTFNDRLLFTPSLRFHSVDDDYSGISRSTENSRTDSVITPQMGVRFNASKTLTLRSSLGQFAREPSFSELFGSRGLILGNSNLEPEKGINAELGFSYEPNKQYRLNATAYASLRDELVVLVFDSQGVGRSVNSGEARIYGVELDNKWTINKQWQVRLNATYQISQNIAENPALNKRELPGEARLNSHAKLQYQTGRIRTWAESNYKSDFYYDSANLLPAKQHWIHSTGIEYQWRKFQFGLTANNISNTRTQDFNGFPRPGRSYYFSINVDL